MEYAGGTLGAGIGQANAVQPPPQRDTILAMINEFDGDINRLEKLCSAMDLLGDALAGSRPEKELAGAATPQPASLLESLRRKREQLRGTISRAENAFQRVASTLG